MRSKLLALTVLFGFAQSSFADLIISAPTYAHQTTAVPTTGSFDITFTVTGATMESLSGYDVVLNFANPTVGTITIDSVTDTANNPIFVATGNFLGTAGVLTGQGADDMLPNSVPITNGLGIFRVNYTLSANAFGPVPITIDTVNTVLSGPAPNFDPITFLVQNGQINAVPEPATLSLAAGALGVGALIRRRQRKANPSVSA